ncbi:MAG TPA: recombinase family protein [Actinomycetota bacterium]|nr:recombinase family protein [Actinomycetota bacterium]
MSPRMSILGRSGADAIAREGFQKLVASVGLGGVGVVLGIEVSRLACNNEDWYQLLDLRALADTLIADQDGVIPADFNDRLVLGLKGDVSEAELYFIRGRLTAGLLHRAGKGELHQGLSVGFDYDDSDRSRWVPGRSRGRGESPPSFRRSTRFRARARWCCRCVTTDC